MVMFNPPAAPQPPPAAVFDLVARKRKFKRRAVGAPMDSAPPTSQLVVFGGRGVFAAAGEEIPLSEFSGEAQRHC